MKVVAVNGSARKEGNTAILLDTVLAELSKEGSKRRHRYRRGDDGHATETVE